MKPSAQRAWGMPGAQGTRSLARESGSRMRTSIHSGGTGNHPAFPHAMVLRLIRALPGELSSVATVAFGSRFCPTRLSRTRLLKDLTRASRVRTTRLHRPRTPPIFAKASTRHARAEAQAPTRHVAPKLQRRRKKIQRRRLRVRGVR